MKEEIRLFVAARLPDDLQSFLQVQSKLLAHPAIRLVPAQNLHLTLFFLGNVSFDNLGSIQEILQEIAAAHQSFVLEYQGTEPGPNARSPRLVWARFEAHPSFEKLSRHLSSALSPAQNPKQKPIPHITLARFRKDLPAPTDLPVLKPDKDIPFQR